MLSLRSQFAEIRRYDKMPRDAPLRVLKCGLLVSDHITVEECEYEITEVSQWNYIRNYFNYNLVYEFTV